MVDVTLEREFKADAETVFAFVTEVDNLLKWWGPEGMTVPEHRLGFTAKGPWFSVMVNPDGQRFKVSGQVTRIDPPRSVSFTWAWHDEADKRGEESHVTLKITATKTGAKLTLDHRELATAEAAESHTGGWISSLKKLEALLA